MQGSAVARQSTSTAGLCGGCVRSTLAALPVYLTRKVCTLVEPLSYPDLYIILASLTFASIIQHD